MHIRLTLYIVQTYNTHISIPIQQHTLMPYPYNKSDHWITFFLISDSNVKKYVLRHMQKKLFN